MLPCDKEDNLTAYVIAEIDVHDLAAYQVYVAAEALEGAAPKRTVVLEFPNADAARRWYHSAENVTARKLRAGCATGRFVLVEGL